MGYFETDERSRWQREYVNIPSWHTHGYLGEGLTIFHDDLGNTAHNGACVDMMQTILPLSKIYSGGIGGSTNKGVITECTIRCNETGEFLPFDEFITKYNISQINNSTDGGKNDSNSPWAVYMRGKIKEHNLIGTGAFGNMVNEPNNRWQGAFIMVSGVSLMKDYSFRDYGVSGDACDFSMFMGFQSGTSFSAPFLNGMIGLIRCKYGRITQEEVYDYLVEHCEDMGTAGWNPEFGHGLPILGDANMEIKMTIGSKVAYVDGKKVLMEQEPFIMRDTGRTVSPVRFVAETLGAEVKWNDKTKEITIIK